MKRYTHLTSEQRYQISNGLKQGYSQQAIADIIGVNKSTLSREIRRNGPNRGRVRRRTARAKGLMWGAAVRRHALPNASIPIVTVGGIYVGRQIAAAVITENVFAWPGIGKLLVNSVQLRDLAVVQCIVILVGVTMVVTNLLVDLAYGWLDPRTRTGDSQ